MKRFSLPVLLTVLVIGANDLRAQGADTLANQVTIYRDVWGIPHVHGETDAAAVFGLAYARAEDQFELIEAIFIRGLGRSSELYGEEGLLTPGWYFAEKGQDLLVHAFQFTEEARSAYDGLPPEVKTLVEAYTAGLNYYLETHPEQEVRLLDRFEPWWLVAVEDFSQSFHGRRFSGAHGVDSSAVMRGKPARGSNTWALGPAKTANGSTMLLMNPHDPSRWSYYECHIMSDEGINSYGKLTFWGPLVLPYIGFNENLGWSVTINYADVGDSFEMTFDHPEDPGKYRFGDDYLTAESWETTVRVRDETGLVSRTIPFTGTVHGPVLGTSENGKPLSFRIARSPSGTLTEQLYRMHRARNLEEWQEAVALRGIASHNLMYADRAGNIYYLYNGNVPVRDDSFDWTSAVDGSDPRTLWQGYHAIEELPQLLNPSPGYLQNNNSSPFVTTHSVNPDSAAYPGYMTHYEWGDNIRSIRSRELLHEASDATLDDLQSMALNTYNRGAEIYIPLLVDEWRDIEDTDRIRHQKLKGPVESLINWDRYSHRDTYETTLYTMWSDAYMLKYQDYEEPPSQLDIFETGVDILIRHFATWRVPYRNIVRHQRSEEDSYHVDPDRPSYPTNGNRCSAFGTMFCLDYPAYDGNDIMRRANFGNSYVAIVEFGDQVRARSILNYGQSMHPDSPHYTDQAEMFANGEMKPVLFAMEDILANLKESYRPAEQRRGVPR
jgi:acyl-homoserine-lactone acylase